MADNTARHYRSMRQHECSLRQLMREDSLLKVVLIKLKRLSEMVSILDGQLQAQTSRFERKRQY